MVDRGGGAASPSSESLFHARKRPLRLLIVVFGLVWLMNALFAAHAWLLEPGGEGAANLIGAFRKPIAGAPLWLKPYLLSVTKAVLAIGPSRIAVAMVAIDALIGLALLSGIAAAPFSWFAILYCFFCWTTLNAFGFPYSDGQTDPGVFVVYMIAFLFILAALARLRQKGAGGGFFHERLWTAARILFGLLWAFDAALKWLPAFHDHFLHQLTSILPGEPPWFAAYLGFIIVLVGALGPRLVATMVALIETLIAAGILAGRGLGLVIPLGLAWSFAVWSTAEAFGGPYTSTGTGVRGNVLGNVLIYMIPFFFLWLATRARIAGKGRAKSERQKSRAPGSVRP